MKKGLRKQALIVYHLNWDLSCCSIIAANFPLPRHCEEGQRPDVAISRYNLKTRIVRKIEVLAKMCHALNILLQPTFYQEIATALRASQ